MNQDPFVGKVIDDRYEIQSRIGEGGMGVVYKARQTSIDRVIAIKMLNPQMASDPTWVQRFNNEARACSHLQHPNTIRMFDFGKTNDGRLFMAMEFLDGMSLREAVSKGPLAPQRVMKILIQCCASLAEAHSIGIIHRDIKPDNVFLLNMAGSPDFVKLLDFSVAKLLEGDRMKTQAGVVFGTPQYMSPEQGRGMPLDARSDLYALGILAFEMLTGNVPFNDENPMTVIQMHLHAAIPPLPQSIPYSVQQIVRRALEKDPNRRYQSSGEMMQHCQQVFAEITQGGMSIGPGGMPKTMIASGPIPGQPGMQPQGMQPQGMQPQGMQPPGMQPPGMQPQGMQPPGMQPPGMQPPGMQPPLPGMPPPMGGGAPPMQASPQQKTMIAQPSPFAQGGMPPGGMPPGSPGPGGFQQASAMQKTIVAGMAPPIMGGQLMPPGLGGPNGPGGPMMPPGYPPMPQMPPGGTAASGPNKTVMLQPSEGVVSVARTGQAVQPIGTGAIQQGASTLFWIVSLVIGVAVGALAYVIVLQL
ncbi:MAG TPA: protein kinase [Kofleriaceae bacterium]|nr:protein kinase [Kofleriaceae bacterium]